MQLTYWHPGAATGREKLTTDFEGKLCQAPSKHLSVESLCEIHILSVTTPVFSLKNH
jgi:hypothetical protein